MCSTILAMAFFFGNDTIKSKEHHLQNTMYSRNLSVLDFVRRFFVSCAQISEAYVDEIRVQLAENQPQRQVQKDSESTLQNKGEFFLWK